MALFRSKSTTIEAKIAAVDDRMKELQKRSEQKERELETAKSALGQRIAAEAMKDTEQGAQDIVHSRKAVERITEAKADVDLQIQVLGKQRLDLVVEGKRSLIAECPERLVGIARVFNKSLGDVVTKLETVKKLWADLLTAQSSYHGLLQQRQAAMNDLKIVEGLELPEDGGLGLLAQSETPWRSSVQVPMDELAFLREVISYRDRLENYKKFKEANPNLGAVDIGDKAGVGEVGQPGTFQGRYQEAKVSD